MALLRRAARRGFERASTPAMAVALLALFIALGGTAFAMSLVGHGSEDGSRVAHKHKFHVKRGSRGPRGPRGPKGKRGAKGQQGATGPAGLPGTARAYGLVSPLCNACLPGPSYNPVNPQYSHNVTAVAPNQGSPKGTYCLSPSSDSGIDAAHAVVVTSVVQRSPQPNAELEPIQESAVWSLGAPDCRAGTLEVRTYGYVEEAGELEAVPDGEVAFSFVIP
jgi:hypothetical protein